VAVDVIYHFKPPKLTIPFYISKNQAFKTSLHQKSPVNTGLLVYAQQTAGVSKMINCQKNEA